MKNIIIEKEKIEFQNDLRVKRIVAILYTLFVVALVSGITYYHENHQTQQNAQDASYQQWLNQGAKNPHGAAHYGFYAFKPTPATAILDKGVEGFLGQVVWLEAHNQNEVKQREANDAGTIVRFGTLSVGFLWQFLMPLAIILLGFNLFSKEREGGTLWLLLSSGSSMWSIINGKALALYQLVLKIVVPMMIIVSLSTWWLTGTNLFFSNIPTLIFTFIFYLLYFFLWVLGSLWVSTWAVNSGISLVTLLGFWVFGTFFIPRMSGSIAKSVYQSPSAFDFSQNVKLDGELGIDRKTTAQLRKKRLDDSLLRQYKVDSLTQLPVDYRGISLEAGEDYGKLIYEKNYGNLHEIYQKQDAIISFFNVLSPALAMRNLSAGLSGTDLNRHLDFTEKAEKHRLLIAKTMNVDIQTNAVGKKNYQNDVNLWKKVPPFQYEKPSVWWALQQQILSIVSIFLWIMLMYFLLKKRAEELRFVA
jgi:ABC-2 type transport system permease protein